MVKTVVQTVVQTDKISNTTESAEQLVKNFVQLKSQLLEILGENSDLVKGVVPPQLFFSQININLKRHGKLRAKDDEVSKIIKEGDRIERHLLQIKNHLKDALGQIDITKIALVSNAIEAIQSGKSLVVSEEKNLGDKYSRKLEKIEVSTRFNTRLKEIQKLLAQEGIPLETRGDLLEFRKKKGGSDGVMRRFKKNMKNVGAKTVLEIEMFLKKE